MEDRCVLVKQSDIRNRMRQVANAREEYKKYKKGVIVPAKKIIELSTQNKYFPSDNPRCAFKGYVNFDINRVYSCPIEDFSEDELKQIDSNREKSSAIH